jgi:DNA-binding beta-propeller fold protein YncE
MGAILLAASTVVAVDVVGARPASAATYAVACGAGDTATLIADLALANSNSPGTLNLTANCTYQLTAAKVAGDGGDGLPVITGAVTINGNGATITRNSAATFRLIDIASGGSLSADDLTLTNGDSTSDNGGGAIFNDLGGKLALVNSTVSGNSNTGGTGGGGIATYGTTSLVDSTVSGNSATYYGGGIWNDGPTTIVNSTIAGNSAGDLGGGIARWPSAALSISYSTISMNSAAQGGGLSNLHNLAGKPLTLADSIVANNSGGDCHSLQGPTIAVDSGYNIDSDGTCKLTASGDQSAGNPQLGALQNNGGPTSTMAPAAASSVVHAIPVGTSGCGRSNVTDQRGDPRPRGAGCDIGSVELGEFNGPDAIASVGGFVWVANSGDNSVTELTAPGGALVQVISNTNCAGCNFSAPDGIASDGQDVWVANWGNGSVTELNAVGGAGTWVNSFSGGSYNFSNPSAVASVNGHVWVANWGNNSVTELTAPGGGFGKWIPAANCVACNHFNDPDAIAIDNNDVWVANGGNSSVTELTAPGGAFVKWIAPANCAACNNFSSPDGIASVGGDVWVANFGNSSVTELTAPGGAFLSWTHNAGVCAACNFSSPAGVAVDSTDVWVANFGNNSVTKLINAGGNTSTPSVNCAGCSFYIDPAAISSDGNDVWVANYADNSVTEFTAPGGVRLRILN